MGKRAREYDEAPADPGSAFTTVLLSISNGSEPLTKVPATSEPDPTATQVPAAKITELDPSLITTKTNNPMPCSLPPHKEPITFSSYQEYESHYRNEHTNRCLECRKNFPSSHLLSLHISENHDAFIQVKRDKGERTVSPHAHPLPNTQISQFINPNSPHLSRSLLIQGLCQLSNHLFR